MDQLHSQTPTRIGEFTIVRPLAKGRHSRVYLGESARGHQVAVKVMDPEAARDRLARQRFARGIDDARRVRASVIPRVLAAGAAAPAPWVATQYLVGPTLAERLTSGSPPTEPEVLEIVADVATCLVALHAVGLVHGELEPSKIVLTDDGARVVDIGANAQFDGSAIDDPELDASTVGFLAPEQVAQDWVGSPADLFALGAVAFWAATGRPVFGTGTGPEIAGRIVHDDPDLSRLANPRLRGLIWDCLAKGPTVRPRAEDVARFARPMSAQRPPVLGMGAGAGSAAAGGAAAATTTTGTTAGTTTSGTTTSGTTTTGATAADGPFAAGSRAHLAAAGTGSVTAPSSAAASPRDRNVGRARRVLPAVFGAFVVAQIGWAALSPSGQADSAQTPSPTTAPAARPGAASPAPAASPARAARAAPSASAARRSPVRTPASPAPTPSPRVLATPLPTMPVPVPGVPLPVLPTPVVPRTAVPAPPAAAPTTPRVTPRRPAAPPAAPGTPTEPGPAPRPTTVAPAPSIVVPPARPTVVPSVEPTTEPTREPAPPALEPTAPIRPPDRAPAPTAGPTAGPEPVAPGSVGSPG